MGHLSNKLKKYLKSSLYIPGIKVRTAFLHRTLIPGINRSGGCETDFKHAFKVQKVTFSLVL